MLHGRLSLMLGARLIPLTPKHHKCEGRPPAFQASRAKRAIQQRRSKRGWPGTRTGARYPIYESRNDGERALLRRQNRPLDLAETDAIAVALAPAAHHQRVAVFEERP